MLFGNFSHVQAIEPYRNTNAQNLTGTPRVYAYYYLWWSDNHWRNKLGPSYPLDAATHPLPAVTDADGCYAVSNYPGNQLLDVPLMIAGQDTPGVIEQDIRDAKSAGITGFWLNWAGEGTTTQDLNSVTYTPRLAEGFAASTRVGGFTNWVSYKVASLQSVEHIINDLNFLYAQFGSEPSWERIDGRPVVTFTGSRRYSDADVAQISNAVRDRIFLVGDESRKTLTDARLAMFDALTYYWSTQDPYGNPESFSQIKEMGDRVHVAGKRWYAPLNPGYNSSLLNGQTNCIPRRNGETLRMIWNGNSASNPDGWGMISWNEISENTHIRPMQKWGNTYLNVLASLIQGGTVTPSTPVPSNPSVPVTSQMYDDTLSSFTYSGGWTDVPDNNSYNGSAKWTFQPGASATFNFTGSSFTIVYRGGPLFSMMDIYVDGTWVGVLDERWSEPTNQLRWEYPNQLATGQHTLQLVFRVDNPRFDRGSVDAVIVR